MPKHILTVAISATFVSGYGSMVQASPSTSLSTSTGYLTSASGFPISTASDNCIRNGSWSQEVINNACEGIEEEIAKKTSNSILVIEEAPLPKPVAETVQEVNPSTVEPDHQPTIETVVLNSRALFANNAYKLSARGNLAMQNLVDKLAEYSEIEKIEIVGYTDSIGTEAYNLALSQRRADTIKGFIVPTYSETDINVQGLGEAEPVGSNKSAEGRQQNRRVEIRVTAKLVKTATV